MLVEVGKIVDGKVSGITNFGAFVQLSDGQTGLVHISEVAEEYVKDIKAHLKENQMVKVKIISVDDKGRISLSIKRAQESKNLLPSHPGRKRLTGASRMRLKAPFEELLAKFMKDSDERMHDIKKSFESKRGGGGYRRSAQY